MYNHELSKFSEAAIKKVHAVKESKVVADLDTGRYVPQDICIKYFNKIIEITTYCDSLMTGEETEPQTLGELKQRAFEHYPSCTQQSFNYLIDKMIENITIEGTFETYKYYFDNLDPII